MTDKPRPGRKIKGIEKRVPLRVMLEPRIIRLLDLEKGTQSRADTLQALILKWVDKK